MNSRWKENLIIFVIALVLTFFDDQIKIRVSSAPKSQPLTISDDQIKIRVFSALESQPQVKLGQS